MKNKGNFIAFEGLDGSGSSTQVELLVKNLRTAGYKAFATKEPTNNVVGGLIRGLLTHDWKTSPEGFQLLFAADRAHHLSREIIPAVEDGNIIISDRYFFSTFAFGSVDLPLNWLKSINSRFPLPDLTFFIKVKPSVCLDRIGKTRHHFEYFEEKTKLEKTFKTYQKLAKDPKNKIITVDGEKPIEEISKEIFDIVKKELEKNES